jgi:hypothetical protein
MMATVRSYLAKFPRLMAAVFLALAFVPAAAFAQDNSASTPSSVITGTLAPGQTASFSFGYAGDNKEVHFDLYYSPAATASENDSEAVASDTGDVSMSDGALLKGFAPGVWAPSTPIGDQEVDQPIPGGPVNPGYALRHWTLRSREGGQYLVTITNADQLGRTETFTLKSLAADEFGRFSVAGPALTPLTMGQ